MKKQKILFLIIAVLFLLILFYFIYDFSTKTTFPGGDSKKTEKEVSG